MPKYNISFKAKEDLKNIWNYTFDNWSGNKADKYLKEIFIEINKIAKTHQTDKSHETIIAGLKSKKVYKHFIFYRILGGLIKVERVLHQRMDFINHSLKK